jgi:hypothetical protein
VAHRVLAIALFGCAAAASRVPAQDPVTVPAAQDTGGWNGARVLDLIARARARRAQPVVDSLLKNYRAKAAGMVYFYLDRRDTDELTPIKSDQIALEVYWGAPDRTKQRIVGMRGEDLLPNRMYYHLDHLTVVQNEFGDVIRLGDGDEVRDVPHPAAPGSDSIYDFRLADSLTIQLPGAAEPVRTYRIAVRPKRSDRSAFVGSLFLDRASADIVRLTFTFTPASYVDRRLDYINISLDNSLWDGRYWLPNEQAVEIRRQLPELDFIAGAVIQGRFRITDYEFNVELPPNFFTGYPVTAVSREEREAYAFETELYEDLVMTGLSPPPQMRELRAQAAALLRERALSGLPKLRPSLPNASSALRYNRAEGTFLGAGASYVPGARFRAELTAGHAFGAERPAASVGVRLDPAEGTRFRAVLFHNELRDIGVRPGMPGALNTITAFVAGDDFTDPYFASGARLTLEHPLAPLLRLGVQLSGERHRGGLLVTDAPVFDDDAMFRPVRAIDEGDLVAARISISRPLRDSSTLAWGAGLSLETGSFDGRFFTRPGGTFTLRRQTLDRRTIARVRAAGGVALGSPASQHLFLLGGRETLPGYGYRSFVGDAFALADFEVTREIAAPWLGLRVLGSAGWAGWLDRDQPPGSPAAAAPARVTWNTRETSGIRPSLGVGASVLYNMLRLDLVRGLDGGEWQFLVSLTPGLWGIL